MEDIIQLDKPENEAQEQVIIKSDLRDKATYYDPSYYQVNFENPYKKVFSFEVLYTYVPRTEYIIDVFNNQLSYSINEQSYKLLQIDPGDQDLTGLVQNMDQQMSDTVYNKNTDTTETVYINVKSMSTQIQYKSKLVFTCKYPFRFDFSQSTAQQPLGFGDYASPYYNTSQYNGVDNVQDYTYLGNQNGPTYYNMLDTEQPDPINFCKLDQMCAQKFLSIDNQILNKIILYFNINNIELQNFTVYIYSHDTNLNQPGSVLTQTQIKAPTTGQQYIVADFEQSQFQLQQNTIYWVAIQQGSIYYIGGQDQICTYQQRYAKTGAADQTTTDSREGISIYTNNSWQFAAENTILTDTQYIYIQQLSMVVQTYLQSDLNKQNTQNIYAKYPQCSNLYNLNQYNTYAQKFFSTQNQLLNQIAFYFNINNTRLQLFTIEIYSHDNTLNQPGTSLIQVTTQQPTATGLQLILGDLSNQPFQAIQNTVYWIVINSQIDDNPPQDYLCTYQQSFKKDTNQKLTDQINTYSKNGILSYKGGNWSAPVVQYDDQYIYIQQLSMIIQSDFSKYTQLTNSYSLNQDNTYAQKFFSAQNQFLNKITLYFNINNTDQQFVVQIYSHDSILNQPGTYLSQVQTEAYTTGQQPIVVDFTSLNLQIIKNTVYWIVIRSQNSTDTLHQDYLCTYQKQIQAYDLSNLDYQANLYSKEGILVNKTNNWSALKVQYNNQYMYIQQLSMTLNTSPFSNYLYNKRPHLYEFYIMNKNITYAQKFQGITTDSSTYQDYEFLDQIIFYLNIDVNKTIFQKYTVQIYNHDTVYNQPLNFETESYLLQTEVQSSATGRVIADFRNSKLKIYKSVAYWVVIKSQDSSENQFIDISQPQDYLCAYRQNGDQTIGSISTQSKEGLLMYTNKNWSIPSIYYDDQNTYIYKLSMIAQTSYYINYDYIYNQQPPQSSNLFDINYNKTYAQKFFSIQNQFLTQIVIYFNISRSILYTFVVQIYSHDIKNNQPNVSLVQTQIQLSQIQSSDTEEQYIIDFTDQQFQILENTTYWVVIQAQSNMLFNVQNYLCTYQQKYDNKIYSDINSLSKEGILEYTNNNWSVPQIQQDKQYIYIQQLSMKIQTYLESDLTMWTPSKSLYNLNQDTIYAQKFLNTKNQFLNKIIVYLNFNNTGTEDQITIQIYSHDNTLNQPSQYLIQTEIQSFQTQSDNNGQYIIADFTDVELQILENTTYWVVIKSSLSNTLPPDLLCTYQQSQQKTDNLNQLTNQINTYSKQGILQFMNNIWFPLQIQQDDTYIYIQQLQIKYIKCQPEESYVYKKSNNQSSYYLNKDRAYAQKFFSNQIQFLNQIIIYLDINKSRFQTFKVQIYGHDAANNQPLSYQQQTYLTQTEVTGSAVGQQQSIIADFTTENFQLIGNTYYWVVIKSQDLSENQPQDILCTYLSGCTTGNYAAQTITYSKGTLVYTDGQWSTLPNSIKDKDTTVYLQQLSMKIQTDLGERIRQIFQSVPSTTDVQGYLFNSRQPQLTDLYNIDKNTVYSQIFYNTEIQQLGQVILYFTIINTDSDAVFTASICSSNTSLNSPLAQTQITINMVNTGKLPTTFDFTSQNFNMLANTYYWIKIQSSSDVGCYQIYTYQRQYNSITDAEPIATYGNGTLKSNDGGVTWSTLNQMPASSGIQNIEQLSMQIVTYKSQYYMNSPGIVQLTGTPYIVMRCREIENHLFNVNYDTIKNFGVGLIPLGVNGFVNTSFNFPSIQQKKFHPIGQLQSLTIEFTRPDGTRYDFKGVDHVIVCNIKFYRKNRPDIAQKMRFSLLNPSLDFRDGDNYYEYQKNFMYNNSKQRQLQQIDDDDIDDSVNSNDDQYYEQIQNDSQQYLNKDLFVNFQKQSENNKQKYAVPNFFNNKIQ